MICCTPMNDFVNSGGGVGVQLSVFFLASLTVSNVMTVDMNMNIAAVNTIDHELQ